MKSSILMLLFVSIPALASGYNDPNNGLARQKSEGGAGLPGETINACMERLAHPLKVKAGVRALRCNPRSYSSCMNAFNNNEKACNQRSPNEKK